MQLKGKIKMQEMQSIYNQMPINVRASFDEYMRLHPELDFGIVYNQTEWEKFERWRKGH